MGRTETRPATPEDLGPLYELHRQALGEYVRQTWGWDERWQARRFRERFDASHTQVIQQCGRDVGCLRVRRGDNEIFLEYITLWPQYQRQGIGTRLIRALMEEARSRCVPLRLSVLRANPATELYLRLGFQLTGGDEHRHTMEWRAKEI